MPTFKEQGQVYHLIRSLQLPEGRDLKYLQIYFIQDQDQIRIRPNIVSNLNMESIAHFQTVLQKRKNNRYIQDLKNNMIII